MQQALKIYWAFKPNVFYFAVFLVALGYIISNGALAAHWYMVLLLLALIPFIEYFTHKYFLHMPQPKEPGRHHIWAWIANRVHYLHHQDPKKVEHIFAEFWLTLPMMFFDFALVWLLTWDLSMTSVFMTAMVGYFLLYEWTHFIAHFDGYTPKNAYGRFLKKYHLWHHYKNEEYWYGITSPVADWFFGKWRDPQAVSASELALNNRRQRTRRG